MPAKEEVCVLFSRVRERERVCIRGRGALFLHYSLHGMEGVGGGGGNYAGTFSCHRRRRDFSSRLPLLFFVFHFPLPLRRSFFFLRLFIFALPHSFFFCSIFSVSFSRPADHFLPSFFLGAPLVCLRHFLFLRYLCFFFIFFFFHSSFVFFLFFSRLLFFFSRAHEEKSRDGPLPACVNGCAFPPWRRLFPLLAPVIRVLITLSPPKKRERGRGKKKFANAKKKSALLHGETESREEVSSEKYASKKKKKSQRKRKAALFFAQSLLSLSQPPPFWSTREYTRVRQKKGKYTCMYIGI